MGFVANGSYAAHRELRRAEHENGSPERGRTGEAIYIIMGVGTQQKVVEECCNPLTKGYPTSASQIRGDRAGGTRGRTLRVEAISVSRISTYSKSSFSCLPMF